MHDHHSHTPHKPEHRHEPHHAHEHTITSELMCHFPYSVFSVAIALIIVSFLAYFSQSKSGHWINIHGAHMLFHSFHFMHIIFAATGTLITFYRFSQNNVKAIILGFLSPAIFCTLSDSILPYIGGRLLGVNMAFHLCFLSELANVLPFMLVGLINGWVMSRHHAEDQGFYSTSSHFIHILISSIASTLYLVSNGFEHWQGSIGPVFLFLIGAVVIPCTLSDVVVPMAFAGVSKYKKS